ncbi:hypothetical protein MMC11_003884 [Xylographa trunciseda]|nr:hypothetical protein [Xylographa trunciseda]
MARPKRAAGQAEPSTLPEPERKKVRKDVEATATARQSKRMSGEHITPPVITKIRKNLPTTAAASRPKRGLGPQESLHKNVKSARTEKPSKALSTQNDSKSPKDTKTSKSSHKTVSDPKVTKSSDAAGARQSSNFSIIIPLSNQNDTKPGETGDSQTIGENKKTEDGPSYWLMKAEPESRIEKGRDVKFSIDDLAARTEQEAWDGVRNLAARNNLRSMTKGDLAFFYHSNCKVPGIVGVMEIVQEHSVDESALDPEHPYFDPKSAKEDPKWSVVHVEYRLKFKEIVKLKDLQKFAQPGGVLKDMQTLRQSRLSVSKVSQKEWDFIWKLAEVDPTYVIPSQALHI